MGGHEEPFRGHFYPRSPCGERRLQLFLYYQDNRFLSTLSLRRATRVPLAELTSESISIHALLAESDASQGADFGHKMNFYPRSPCGERRMRIDMDNNSGGFLSTLSLRRATMIHPRSCNAKPNFYPRSPCGERLSFA